MNDSGSPFPGSVLSRGIGRAVADLAIVFGSGIAVLPDGCTVIEEVCYRDLGWPVSQVEGHANRLLLCAWERRDAAPMRVLLLFGRPHRYEGWDAARLEQPVDEIASWGVRRLLITNACGSLSDMVGPGDAVLVHEVIDLQEPPAHAIEHLTVTDARVATRCADALSPWLPACAGRYVAVAGPHYETPAEVRWLARHGDVVGMSSAPEERASARHGISAVLLALVVNRAGTETTHAEVLAAAGRCAGSLKAGGLTAVAHAAWPELDATSHEHGSA